MSNQTVQDDEIDLRHLFGVLLEGKWTIVSVLVVFVVFATVKLSVTDPDYVARALIQVEKKQGAVAGLASVDGLFDAPSTGDTEIAVLNSRLVLGEVVRRELLNVNVNANYFPFFGKLLARYRAVGDEGLPEPIFGLAKYSVGAERLEFSQFYSDEFVAPLSLKLIAKSDGKFDVFDPLEGKTHGGEIGNLVTVRDGLVVFEVGEFLANPGMQFNVSVSRDIDAVGALRSGLAVEELGRDTGIISLRLKGKNKAKIKSILNSIVETYKSKNVKRLSEEADNSIRFLSDQIPKFRAELEAAEQALNKHRSKNSSINIELETKAALEQLVAVEAQLSELEFKESDIRSRYREDHPVYGTLLEQRENLTKEKERFEIIVSNMPASQQVLLGLMRDVEVTNEIYIQLLSKLEELKVIRAGTVGNIRILDPAETQTLPVAPKSRITILMAIIFGLVSGCGIVVMRRFMGRAILDPMEVQEKLGIVNYGVVPASAAQSQLIKNNAGPLSVSVLAMVDRKDLALEAIRSVRTSLHFAMMEASDNIVMLTGPSPGIGKSFVSTNLAALIGEAGQKVLLIDADLRRGHINKTMGVKRQQGLSEHLSKGLSLDSVIHENILDNVDFIATGDIPPNPSELLMSGRFSDFLDAVKGNYDLVIIDTPPTLAVTDAMLVGKQVGTCMSVVRHNTNTLGEVEQMKVQADKLGVVIKGYIYNFMEYNTSYGNRYYNYGYYGMNEDEQGSTNA